MPHEHPRASPIVTSHRELDVWAAAFDASMHIFRLSKRFPREERYSLTDQIRRSSRSVTTSITEAWRRRRYEGAFVEKLNQAEAEAAETQDWLHYAVECGYLDRDEAADLYRRYDAILTTLVGMIRHSNSWVLPMTPAQARKKKHQPKS